MTTVGSISTTIEVYDTIIIALIGKNSQAMEVRPHLIAPPSFELISTFIGTGYKLENVPLNSKMYSIPVLSFIIASTVWV